MRKLTIKNRCGGKKKGGCSVVKNPLVIEWPYFEPIKKAA